MEQIKVDHSRCKGCYFCIDVCPVKAISVSEHMSKKGYAVIEVNQEKCIQCGSCFQMCPDYVFEIG